MAPSVFGRVGSLLVAVPLASAEAPELKIQHSYVLDPIRPLLVKPHKKLFNLSPGEVDSTISPVGTSMESTSTRSEDYAITVAERMKMRGRFRAFSLKAHQSFQHVHKTSMHTVKRFRVFGYSKVHVSIKPIDLFSKMAEYDQHVLTTGEPSDIRKLLGEFYARTADYGGMFKSMYSREISASEVSNTVAASVQANQFSWGIRADGSVQTTQDNHAMTTYFQMSCFGGDPLALTHTGDCNENCVQVVQRRWADTLNDDNLVETGATLFPIWELLNGKSQYQAQRDKIMRWFFSTWAAEEKSIPPESGYVKRSCHDSAWVWCDGWAGGRRRRRAVAGYVEREALCPDGCFVNGHSTRRVWCNDHGGYYACTQSAGRRLNMSEPTQGAAATVVSEKCSSGQELRYDTPKKDFDLAGRTLETLSVDKVEDCCIACSDSEDCKGFSYTAQICDLKSEINGTLARPGTFARTKKPVYV